MPLKNKTFHVVPKKIGPHVALRRGDSVYDPGEGLYASGSGVQREPFLLEKQIYGDITDKPKRKSIKIKI